jgi:hypothetical protein
MINANLNFFLSFVIIHFSFPYFSFFPFPLFFSFFLILSDLLSSLLFFFSITFSYFIHRRVAARLQARAVNGGQQRGERRATAAAR